MPSFLPRLLSFALDRISNGNSLLDWLASVDFTANIGFEGWFGCGFLQWNLFNSPQSPCFVTNVLLRLAGLLKQRHDFFHNRRGLRLFRLFLLLFVLLLLLRAPFTHISMAKLLILLLRLSVHSITFTG